MYTFPVLERDERERHTYYCENNNLSDLKNWHTQRIQQGLFHEWAESSKKRYMEQSKGEPPTQRHMWNKLKETIRTLDTVYHTFIRAYCKKGYLQGYPEDIITDIAFLCAGKTLENGKP